MKSKIARLYHIFFAITLCMGYFVSSPPALSSPLNAIEVPLTAFQKDRMMEDFPYTSAHVSRDQRYFYLLGSRYFWKWDLTNQKMSRIKLPLAKIKKDGVKDPGGSKERLLVPYTKDSFVIANEKEILYVNLDPLKINKIRYPSTFQHDVPIEALFYKKKLYVIFSAGTWISTTIKNDNFSSLTLKNNPLGKPGGFQYAVFNKAQRKLYLSSEGKLLAVEKWPHNDNLKEIIQIPEKIMSLNISKKSLYVSTKKHVLRFQNDSEQLLQIIPVASENSIQNIALDEVNHAYLLQNNNLYLYNLKNQAKLVYRLPFKGAKINNIHFLKRVGSQKYALLKDGFPFVFSLPHRL